MSVICDKCGEELMGAVNRCWKCGTPFRRVEGKPNPPVRRAPVLAAYVYPESNWPENANEEVLTAIVEEEPEPTAPDDQTANDTEPDSPSHPRPLIEVLKSLPLLDPARVDYACIGTSLLAVFACLLGTASILAIPVGIAASILSVHLLSHRASLWRWISFALGVMAMIVALLGIISFLFTWWVGGNLYTTLMSPPI